MSAQTSEANSNDTKCKRQVTCPVGRALLSLDAVNYSCLTIDGGPRSESLWPEPLLPLLESCTSHLAGASSVYNIN
ncbi:hypothetical protein ALO36_103933 [Pseudomonas syringae pv. tomato]|uniref:Uncharacterized protein n=2 Tax=Pseudomonas syringae group genomosp. 3 TaxID=251701 RepID=A0A3M4TMX4_9PSED|nr:hypothetical protein ALO36_103933 [Pseudomonas syringae pv. tomato]RMR28604.1 hypothetical protein ALP87_102738 [Pseudomonas syringae pv. coriandricola]RMU12665.1 hypothetical protein ALP36_102820 [Pseudomonas syringae pv. coriandricola]RMV30622.1 hypothetical protein ALP13_103735 [Pseudomonas syringae pv. maculicola]